MRSTAARRLFAYLVCAAYWLHPLSWIIRRQLRLEAERACDDAAMRGSDPETYAEQLVSLAESLVERSSGLGVDAIHEPTAN